MYEEVGLFNDQTADSGTVCIDLIYLKETAVFIIIII